jgi:co-chaperonin GroES (HSP10)
MRPMGARVLVKRLDEPRPQSTIIIPETIEDRPSQYALVLAIGDLKQGGFDIGDTVILTHFAGAPCNVMIEGELIEGAIVGEDDVLAVVEES